MNFSKHNDHGYMTVFVFILLAVITILCTSVCRVSNTDLWISINEGKSKTNFYVAEGGNIREAKEVANGAYEIDDVYEPGIIATESIGNIPRPRPHEVDGKQYDFIIKYEGVFIPPKGFSAINFNRYDYEIETRCNEKFVITRYCTIGTKE
jgi:hypothetical protein